jgi:hypothetical protein
MCHAVISIEWVVKNLTDAVVMKFHCCKCDQRVCMKFNKRREYCSHPGNKDGVYFHPSKVRGRSRKLLVTKTKLEHYEDNKLS